MLKLKFCYVSFSYNGVEIVQKKKALKKNQQKKCYLILSHKIKEKNFLKRK